MLITSGIANSAVLSVLTVVGKAKWTKGECYTVASFKAFLDHNHSPPASKINMSKRIDNTSTTKTRIMIEPDLQSLLDVHRVLCTLMLVIRYCSPSSLSVWTVPLRYSNSSTV